MASTKGSKGVARAARAKGAARAGGEATSAGAAGAHVALLRGINVGGKNALAMRDLVAVFEALGCVDVATYIQSGNVVFRAPASLARAIPERAAAAIRERFGLAVPVIVRGAEELDAVARANPFLASGADPATLHVVFLAEAPPAARVAALDPARSPPDAFAVVGREVYLSCPNGLGRSKLTNDFFDRGLATTSTARNWRTVLTLRDMAMAVADLTPPVRPVRARGPSP